jgi:hypothetical protein
LQGLRAATSDARGLFRLDQLAPGRWTLRVRSPAHPELVAQGETRPGERALGLELVLGAGAELSGFVRGLLEPRDLWVRARPAEAREGSFVALEPSTADAPGAARPPPEPPRHARCAADGSFTLAGLRPGARYRLEVVRDPADPLAAALNAPLVASAGASAVELVLAGESALLFRVVDAASGAPVTSFSCSAGALHPVALLDERGRPRREFADGRARFPLALAAPGDPLRLLVEAPGFRPLELSGLVLPAAGAELDLGTLRLERAP